MSLLGCSPRAGLVTKKPLSQEDVNIVVDLFRRLKPAQIYAAGDLSDPHGTHRTCLQVAIQSLYIVLHLLFFVQSPPSVVLYVAVGHWQVEAFQDQTDTEDI